MGVFTHFQERFDAAQEEELSLRDYLELCKTEPVSYATAAERLVLCYWRTLLCSCANCRR